MRLAVVQLPNVGVGSKFLGFNAGLAFDCLRIKHELFLHTTDMFLCEDHDACDCRVACLLRECHDIL